MVPHHSTDYAINCLTAQIGRDAVGLVVYGRSLKTKRLLPSIEATTIFLIHSRSLRQHVPLLQYHFYASDGIQGHSSSLEVQSLCTLRPPSGLVALFQRPFFCKFIKGSFGSHDQVFWEPWPSLFGEP